MEPLLQILVLCFYVLFFYLFACFLLFYFILFLTFYIFYFIYLFFGLFVRFFFCFFFLSVIATVPLRFITKRRLFKYIENFTSKIGKLSDKRF